MVLEDALAVQEHLRAVDDTLSVTRWQPLGGGRSATSVRVGLSGERGRFDAVLHLQPDGGPLAGISDAARQYALLRALAPLPVASPDPLWALPASVLGRPGYLTAFVPGDVPDPWTGSGRAFLADQAPGGPLARELVRRMVEIHRVPLDALPDALLPDDGRTPAQREHERWSQVLARSPAFADDPVFVYADRWLAANAPAPGPAGLVHGDYRIGNVVVDGDAITSVLDWELAEVGDPLYDLAVICAPPLRIGGLAGGLWERDGLVAAYEQAMGTTVDRAALDYYGVLGTFKIACLWVNSSLEFSRGATDLVSLRAACSALELRPLLADALGLPAVAHEPVVPDPALLTVRHAVRSAVDGLSRGADGESLRLSAAVLRTLAQTARPADQDAFAAAVDALAGAVGTGKPVGDGDGDPSRRLAAVARVLLGRPRLARDIADPLHARLRALIAQAAVPGRASWP